MRQLYQISALLLLSFLPLSAFASDDADMNVQKYWKNVVQEEKFMRPYLQDGKHPLNAQWYGKEWYAEDWLVQYERDLDLIDGFYKADILREQVVDKDETPVLVVGPNFYRLSGYDQRRITHVVDVVYNVTAGSAAQVFKLRDWKSGRDIGHYSSTGLVLQ